MSKELILKVIYFPRSFASSFRCNVFFLCCALPANSATTFHLSSPHLIWNASLRRACLPDGARKSTRRWLKTKRNQRICDSDVASFVSLSVGGARSSLEGWALTRGGRYRFLILCSIQIRIHRPESLCGRG